MSALLFSVLLFGLVHPGSKLILETGIPLSSFCVLYVGIRFVAQIPAHAFHSLKSKGGSSIIFYYLLVLLGLFGAGLQFFEFKGVDDGLDPALVTFVMFSYPAWLGIGRLFADRNSQKSLVFFQIAAGTCGLFLVCASHIKSIGSVNPVTLVFPLLASLCIAGWIGLSNVLKRKGLPSRVLSFYYDLFSLVALLTVLYPSLQNELNVVVQWLSQQINIVSMVAFSLVVGLLPNVLFYEGNKKVTAFTAGMLMALEPVVSTVYSQILWGEALSSSFYVGAILIILVNIPSHKIPTLFKRRFRSGRATTLSPIERA